MKIAVLSTFPPRKCGIAYLTQNLFDEFRASGHELVTFGVEDSASDHPLDTRSMFGLLKAAEVIKREKIDRVSVQFIFPFYGKKHVGLNFLLFLFALRKHHVVVTLHEVHRIRSWRQLFRKPADLIHILLEQLIARLSARVILLTETQEKDLRTYGARNTRAVYLGIRTRTVPRDRTVLNRALFFGKLLPAKGAHLFPAIARACPDIHFTIACSVEAHHLPYSQQLAKDLEGIPNVEFICKEWIGDEEKERYFAEADFLVLPYIDTYYQSGVASESGVYNIPVIVPRMGPLSELTLKFRTGETVEYPSPDQIKSAIQKLRANYPDYLAGIQRYREEANWANVARRYLDVLNIP